MRRSSIKKLYLALSVASTVDWVRASFGSLLLTLVAGVQGAFVGPPVLAWLLGLGFFVLASFAIMLVVVGALSFFPSLRMPRIEAGSPSEIFVGTRLRRMVRGGLEPVRLRLIGIPFSNQSRASDMAVSGVTAIIEVWAESEDAGVLDGWVPPLTVEHGSDPDFPRPVLEAEPPAFAKGDRLSRTHGRWRGLPAMANAIPRQPLARSAILKTDQQQQVLDVLVQEMPETRPYPGWMLATDPLELFTACAPLRPGSYRLEVRLLSPELPRPAKFVFDLEIPSSEMAAPILISR